MKPKIQRCCGAMHEPSTHARVCLPAGSSAVSMALKFLHKKGWHPATLENQRRKWIAEQKVWSPQQNGVAAKPCTHVLTSLPRTDEGTQAGRGRGRHGNQACC